MSRSLFTSQKAPITKQTVTHLECFLENIGRLRPVGIRRLERPVVVRVSAVCVVVRALAPRRCLGKEEFGDSSHIWPMGRGEISMGRASMPRPGLRCAVASVRFVGLRIVLSAFATGVMCGFYSNSTVTYRRSDRVHSRHKVAPGQKHWTSSATGDPTSSHGHLYLRGSVARVFPLDSSENPGRRPGAERGEGSVGAGPTNTSGSRSPTKCGSCRPAATHQGDLLRMCGFAFRT